MVQHTGSAGNGAVYVNPVYPKSFPDPFVFKFRGTYYGYCTGLAADGNVFPILNSNDLVNWAESGSAMAPLADSPPLYWAPELYYGNGKFYLYYSTGNETLMEIRVAVSGRPDGGFVDSGKRLTTETFAIDPHVFVDDDGTKYLFYATDFLEHTHIGTGTVVDRMVDWFTLSGSPTVVTRAKYDWQVYDSKRAEKGGVRWHTVEGPAVVKRKGIYYEMFSGGNWQNMTYGVSFATSDKVQTPDEWRQFSDGEKVLPILRTIPGLVIGPGHNSLVRGPNNRELYCIYHRWTEEGRVMAIDRTDFAGKRIFVTGATTTPQPAPFRPSNSGPFVEWAFAGEWEFQEREAISSGREMCTLNTAAPESFLVEVSCRLIDSSDGSIGCRIERDDEAIFEVAVTADGESSFLSVSLEGTNHRIQLSQDFSPTAYHLLRIERDRSLVNVALDFVDVFGGVMSDTRPAALSIFTTDASGGFSGFGLTEGFEESYESGSFDPQRQGWNISGDGVQPTISANELVLNSRARRCVMYRNIEYSTLEYACALRLVERTADDWSLGIFLLDFHGKETLGIAVDQQQLSFGSARRSVPAPVSVAIDWHQHHQLRIVRTDAAAMFYIDDHNIGSLELPEPPAAVELTWSGATIAIDHIRLTRVG